MFCLNATNGMRPLPPFSNDYQMRISIEPIQALITSYQFQCSGRINMWATYVRPGGASETYSIQFQVWRLGLNECYTLVGNNTFQNIELSGELFQEVVNDNQQIQVQPGDVVGYHLTYDGVGSLVNPVGLLYSEMYTTESVWLTTLSSPWTGNLCPNPNIDHTNQDGLPLRTALFNGPIIAIGFCERESSNNTIEFKKSVIHYSYLSTGLGR